MKQFYFDRIWIYLLAISCLYVACSRQQKNDQPESGDSLKGTISLSGAFAVYPLAVQWGEEFKKIHPDVRFDIQGGGAGKGMADALSGSIDIGMVSRAVNEEETRKGAFSISIAKDAVVPTISSSNPHLAELLKRGITRDELKAIFIDGKAITWNDLLHSSGTDKIALFTRSDAAGAPETWAKFLGGKQEDLKGTGVFGDPGLAEAVMKGPLALGFNNINYVFDIRTRKVIPGIQPLPIDLNANGKIDSDEDFYQNIDSLNQAVVKNKFPSPPARELFFVTKGKPSSPLVKAFLNWVLANGQESVESAGYVKLDQELILQESAKLNQ